MNLQLIEPTRIEMSWQQ